MPKKIVTFAVNIIPSATFYPKDFLLTFEGLVFAVVAADLEAGKVLGSLRYRYTSSGWQKLATVAANALLAEQYPLYLHFSVIRDTACHAVPLDRIAQHFQPQQRLQQLLQTCPSDPVLKVCVELVNMLVLLGINSRVMGVTGSLLIGAQHSASDIDLVFDDRMVFHRCRQLLPDLIAQQVLQPLVLEDWQQAYDRRDCELNFTDYVWHEQRKANKAMFKGRKVDFSFVCRDPMPEQMPFQKMGTVTRKLNVLDDVLAYDFPAEFSVTGADVEKVLCFTATYMGQAIAGEWIEVAGQLEVSAQGLKRIVVGASREAKGEYIKVISQ